MTQTDAVHSRSFITSWGLVWLAIAIIGAALVFRNGLDALFLAWQTPEYSHGPIIPVLSTLLFLREMRRVPVDLGPKPNRWPGVLVVGLALTVATLGILSNIDDLVAYSLILWIAGILLISWGWRDGWTFWPSVLHLVYMLPLPGVIYYKVSTSLQFISSELGVAMLRALSVPVFLEGNIIDLGVTKLHVAEACSGLRYMFPILSFSYVFAVLYKGPVWHKAVLLLSAVPIAILMNSLRIALAGIIVQYYGNEWLEGFSHFFEGWVIFLACIVILFGLARLMLALQPTKMSLADALDLDTTGLGAQLARIRNVMPSPALITAALMGCAVALGIAMLPERGAIAPDRDNFTAFPRVIGEWHQSGPSERLTPDVEKALAADDYHQITLRADAFAQPVGLFMAYYKDQSKGGVHSPEICLPGAGWEIAWLERSDVTQTIGSQTPFHINRAIIQKGESRMMVYYWFQQKERRIAWDFAAKFWLMVDGIRTGRTDGALVRLTTPIAERESDEAAEARLIDALQALQPQLPHFIPEE